MVDYTRFPTLVCHKSLDPEVHKQYDKDHVLDLIRGSMDEKYTITGEELAVLHEIFEMSMFKSLREGFMDKIYSRKVE